MTNPELEYGIPERCLDYINHIIRCYMVEIQNIAAKARSRSRGQGHHCDYKAAIDAICDKAKTNAEVLNACWQVYNTGQLKEIDTLRTENATLKRRLDEAMKGLEAYKRLERGAYMNWGYAGGPNECEHGYAEGIPCPKCDQKTADTTLIRITEIDKL